MVLEIIGFILAILGVILFIMSYSDEGDDSIRCCCGLILVIFVTYLYGHFGIIGRVIILLVLYSLYFANEPEKLSKIIDTIDKFINWIDNLSKKDEDNSNNAKIEETNEIQKYNNINYKKNNEVKDKSHYYYNLLDINKATKEELMTIGGITPDMAQKIINLRRKGKYITTYSELKPLLNLSSDEYVKILRNIHISEDLKKEEPKKQNTHKKPVKKENSKPKQKNKKTLSSNKNKKTPQQKQKEIKKVDINKANYSDINGIPGLTSLMASKIIKLRTQGRYIKSFDDLKNVLDLSQFQLDQIKQYIKITYDSKNSKDKKSQEKSKPTELKKTKINFNTCSLNDLRQLNILSSEDISNICITREKSVLNSFGDLEQKANINQDKIRKLREKVIIEANPIKNKETVDSKENMKEIDNDLDNKPNNQQDNKKESSKEKIDINTSDEQTLSQIPHINIIKAKKIIDLRNQNIYITSYEDLESKLSLTHSQIKQIKEVTTISKPKINPGRIIDI